MKIINYDCYHPVRFLKNEANIYFCPKCNQTLEVRSYQKLPNVFESVRMLGITKMECFTSVEFNCCEQDYKAYFHKRVDEQEFFLIEIRNSIIKIEGIKTREECQIIFEKLTRRWDVLYNFTVIVTPFVGYERQTNENFLLLGNWLLECIDKKRTVIITRKKTLKRFDEAFKEDKVILSLKKKGILTDVFNDAKKYATNNFHAKVYFGYSHVDKKVEILEGAWNIGPASDNYENLSFKTCSIDEYVSLYYNKLGFFVRPFQQRKRICLVNAELSIDKISYNSEGVNLIKGDYTVHERVSVL